MKESTLIEVEDHFRLAYAMAHRFSRHFELRASDRDDVQQEAMLALVRATQRYNNRPSDRPWKWFASVHIRWALYRWLVRRPIVHPKYHDRHEPIPKQDDLLSPRVVRATLKTTEPELGLVIQEMLVALSRLPEKDRTLIARRYGLEGQVETL